MLRIISKAVGKGHAVNTTFAGLRGEAHSPNTMFIRFRRTTPSLSRRDTIAASSRHTKSGFANGGRYHWSHRHGGLSFHLLIWINKIT
jgi:hypothetical protein